MIPPGTTGGTSTGYAPWQYGWPGVSTPTPTSWNWRPLPGKAAPADGPPEHPSARQIARHRHEFLETFLSEFLAEWDGTDIPAS
jgi:hypothetical protein